MKLLCYEQCPSWVTLSVFHKISSHSLKSQNCHTDHCDQMGRGGEGRFPLDPAMWASVPYRQREREGRGERDGLDKTVSLAAEICETKKGGRRSRF